jgi:hypothetical protein
LWRIRREFREQGKSMVVEIPRSPLPPPQLVYRGKGQWELQVAYVAKIPEKLVIPAGFRFDLASIPRVFWWLIAPFELGIVAPLVHDYLYRTGGLGRLARHAADDVFRALMIAERVPLWRIELAYQAVRLFSGGSWRG